MRIIMIETSAEELSANKRVGDKIINALTKFCDELCSREENEEDNEDDRTE